MMPLFVAANLLLAPAAPAPPLRVMTFNLRFAGAQPPHGWPERRPLNKALLDRHQPDLIGTQEGLYPQLRDIAADQPGLAWLGMGREGGSRGEFMAVFYRTARLEPLEFDHFWLSDTPQVMGSRSWGNNCVRMVTWVRFRDKASDQQFYLLNTHLDHESQISREHSAALILARAAGLDAKLPLIITGDFNVAAGHNKVYDQFVVEGGLRDTWTTASERGPLLATYHGYREPRAVDERIDWILTRGEVGVGPIAILTDGAGDQRASDHFPVMVELRVGPEPRPAQSSAVLK